jgi:hypothetical protein
LQQVGHLSRPELPVHQPFGIVVTPDQTVSANLHAVSLREADDFTSFAKVETARMLAYYQPSSHLQVRPC